MFAITKTLKGQIDYISDKVPHLALANRLISMNIINSINAGDKIIYVYNNHYYNMMYLLYI